MGAWARIKQRFTGIDQQAHDIATADARQQRLQTRREALYEEIVGMEEEEEELLREGKSADSKTKKRRLAGQLNALRKDIDRKNQSAVLLGKQINVLATNSQNLKTRRLNEVADLPDAETLAENATVAEEFVEQVNNSSELADGLTTSCDISDDEAAIMAEFEPEKVAKNAVAKDAKTPARTGPEGCTMQEWFGRDALVPGDELVGPEPEPESEG